MRRRGGALVALALAVLAGTAGSCTVDGSAAHTSVSDSIDVGAVVDGRGVRLSTDTRRERVVSIVPSMTETLVALGVAPRLVGRTRFDEDPRIADVPSVGGSVNPDVEAIVGVRPDLVVAWADDDARALAARLESLGLDVYAARAESIADFERHALALGKLLHREGPAEALVARVRGRLEALRVDVSDEGARPSVLFVVWPRPLITTGRGTFMDELIRTVGGRGLFDDVEDPWPTVSFEDVLERNPDVVVVASEHAEGVVPGWIEQDPLWRTLDAVREGRVHLVDADRFNRPGPGMADAAEELAGYVRAAADGSGRATRGNRTRGAAEPQR